MAQRLAEVGHLRQQRLGVAVGGHGDGEHPHAVAADGDRQVDRGVGQAGAGLDERFLGAEGAALRAAVDRYAFGHRAGRIHGLEGGHAVVGQAEDDPVRAVALAQELGDDVDEGVGCRGAQRPFDVSDSFH